MVLTPDDDQSVATVGLGVFLTGTRQVGQRGENSGVGAALFGTAYLTGIIGVAGEVSAFNDSSPAYATQSGHAALAGIELRTPLIRDPTSRWRVFGRVLAGHEWRDRVPRQRAVQIAGGADDYLRSGLVLHVEYALREFSGESPSTGRYFLGLAVPIGSR